MLLQYKNKKSYDIAFDLTDVWTVSGHISLANNGWKPDTKHSQVFPHNWWVSCVMPQHTLSCVIIRRQEDRKGSMHVWRRLPTQCVHVQRTDEHRGCKKDVDHSRMQRSQPLWMLDVEVVWHEPLWKKRIGVNKLNIPVNVRLTSL